MTAGTPNTQDNSQNIDLNWFVALFVDMNDMLHNIKTYANNVASIGLHPIPAGDIQNFVFPGAKVFTYKDVQFSNNQDLVTSITYLTPTEQAEAALPAVQFNEREMAAARAAATV